MQHPQNFEIKEHYACFRPTGTSRLGQAVDTVSDLIAFCGEKNISKILINVTGLKGYSAPSLFDRYSMVEKFASVAKAGMKVVLVADQTMIDPNKFGVTVARNRGLNGNVFCTEAEAVAWLLGP